MLLLLFGLSLARAISDMAFLLLELLVIACAVCLHTGFRRRTASRFALLQDVLLTDCDPGKYLAAMEALHATSPEELEAARGYLKCTQEGPVPPLLQKKAAEVRSLIDERAPIEE